MGDRSMANKTARKFCPGCKKTKALRRFRKDNSNRAGLRYICRMCERAKYAANRDRWGAYGKLRAARVRAEEDPNSEAAQRLFRELQKDFEREYGPLEARPSRGSAAEALKQRQQKHEEMFNRILEYQKTNWP